MKVKKPGPKQVRADQFTILETIPISDDWGMEIRYIPGPDGTDLVQIAMVSRDNTFSGITFPGRILDVLYPAMQRTRIYQREQARK